MLHRNTALAPTLGAHVVKLDLTRRDHLGLSHDTLGLTHACDVYQSPLLDRRASSGCLRLGHGGQNFAGFRHSLF